MKSKKRKYIFVNVISLRSFHHEYMTEEEAESRNEWVKLNIGDSKRYITEEAFIALTEPEPLKELDFDGN